MRIYFSALIYSVLLLACLMLAGCGSWRISDLWNRPDAPTENKSQIETSSPQQQAAMPAMEGIQAPQIPAELQSAPDDKPATNSLPAHAEQTAPSGGVSIRYVAQFQCEAVPDMAEKLQQLSILTTLQNKPPDDLMGLDYRIRNDEELAIKIMQSEGYYDGSVERQMNTDALPVRVRLILHPGKQYTLGQSHVQYTHGQPEKAPRNLIEAGMPKNAPAQAEKILDIIDTIAPHLRQQGYPMAQTHDKKFAINPDTHQLYAHTVIDEGPLARMNTVRMQGSKSVDLKFFQRMRNWRKGQIWNKNIVDAYHDILTQKGIFRSVIITPVPAERLELDDDGLVADAQGNEEKPQSTDKAKPFDLLVQVEDGPQKSVGGGLNIDSERGVGVQAFWEHRNLFGQAENLRLKAEIWNDTKEISQQFNKPGFLSRNTAIVSKGWLREENTDAYEQKAGYIDGGLQHRFGKYFWGTIKASMEGGSLKDAEHPNQSYSMLGIPLQLRFDTTNSLLNATRGVRVIVNTGPYIGSYAKDFAVFPTRLDVQGFVPLIQDDKLVLALRASNGTLWRNDATTVPASIRYYSGGGGSVRGYDYQSLGKHDKKGNPYGGASFSEVSAELRYKITENLGIVPFLDGGLISQKAISAFYDEEILWSTGLGFRYYTGIGPVRVDIAMPLNPRDGDNLGPAFYISIGQSF